MIGIVDHLVLNVADVEAMIAFYRDALLLVPERVEAYRRGEAPFPSMRLNADSIIDLFTKELWDGPDVRVPGRENLNHFCITLSSGDWAALHDRLAALSVGIEVGPVPRWGAHGVGTSIYFRDPEGNLVEARYYD
jgi:catechol 2,3-dioxygenase-like lactoylglutathione lyase family enzyme